MKSFTIAIPAYRRPQALRGLLEELAETPDLVRLCNVLVVDDGGLEDVSLGERASDVPWSQFGELEVRYVRHATNQGYARTLIRLFRETDTPWMIQLADDDRLYSDGVRALSQTIEDSASGVGVDVVTSPFIAGDRSLRHRSQVGRLNIKEALTMNGHAPGVAYRVEAVRPQLTLLEERLERGCTMAHTYPQVVLLLGLLLEHDGVVVFQREAIAGEGPLAGPASLKDISGASYGSFAARLRQLVDLEALLDGFESTEGRELIRRHGRRRTLNWILTEDPSLRGRILRDAGLRELSRAFGKALMRRLAKR